MKISTKLTPTFKRRLKSSEEAEYCDVLKRAKDIAAGGSSKRSLLIIPTPSLPQSAENNTGVGNLSSEESQKFFDFAKKYWGINEVQLLPTGQLYFRRGMYQLYSSSSMSFGNHMIDIKSVLQEEDYKKLVENNTIKTKINFSNVVDKNSMQENLLKKLFDNKPDSLKNEFENYKVLNRERLLPKSIYCALSDLYGTNNYKKWKNLDANLFDDRIVSILEREKRISEILEQKKYAADFYLFKQFLAEKSFKNAKNKLNQKGLKVNGDIPCGFSTDERWANPKAFIKDASIGWGAPAYDFSTEEAEKLLREKIRFYAERFDGYRIDAAWTYAEPTVTNYKTGQVQKFNWGDKFLKIIEDETLKVKGKNFDLSNITHEFTADPNIYGMFEGSELKSYVKDRVKIHTSDYISYDWGASQIYKKRGWNSKYFIMGAANHDSYKIQYNPEQAKILSKLLKIPAEKLKNYSSFLKVKFAEPLCGENSMIFFMPALGSKNQYKENSNLSDNYTAKIPDDFEAFYQRAVQRGEAYNPMDGLEKQFKAQGLDKKHPQLFKKIKKYRKILEQKENKNYKMITASVISAGIASIVLFMLYNFYKKTDKKNNL